MKLDTRLLRQARAARLALILAIVLGLLAGIVIVVQAQLISGIVSGVFLEEATLAGVRPLLIGLLAFSLLRAGLTWGGDVAANRVAGRVKRDLRERLVAHLLALGPAYARGERSGELTNTLVEGIEALDAYFRQYLPQLALAALIPLTILFFVFPLDWISGLVLLITAPLIPIFMILIGHAADALTKRQWVSLSRMSAHFLDVLQGLSTLKLLGQSRQQIKMIAQISDRYRQTTMGVLRVTFLSALVLEMVGTISTAVVAVQIGLRLLYGQMAFEEAFFILLLAPEFYLPLRNLGLRFHASMAGVAAAQRIFEVLDTEPEVAVVTPADPADSRLGSSFSLRFEEVGYTYREGGHPALDSLSFSLAPGQQVALVGPSGAGKSTVAYLLLRFLEPQQGRIVVDDLPLGSLSPDGWRQQVAWVPQSPYLFAGTVAGNIRLARPEATPDEVAWAARQAHAEPFIEALPEGYDTAVGERGQRLSAGQAQRIALARAFLKDAPLLVLDEATANLDPETEALVQDALAHLLVGRTALIIAHRLSTVSRVDRILVMEEGRVVEEGNHEVLLEREGLYRQLVGAHQPGGAT